MTAGSRVTRVLLACGAIGAFLFLVVFHLDAATRARATSCCGTGPVCDDR